MEIEHFVGIGIALVVSVILVWIVWSYFCSDKGDPEGDEESDPAESCASFTSSTTVITKRGRESPMSSCNDATTDEESEGPGHNKSQRSRKKTKRKGGKASSYNYQQNKYGLHDPFGEWAPNQHVFKEPSSPVPPKYPKSPLLKHKPLRIQHH